jgi:pyrroloquinoline quinone (PQQ) biosynthesis protein C
MLSTEDFKKRLRRELESQITIEQPVFAEVFRPTANYPLLRLMASQGYQLTKHFLDYVEALFYFCPKGVHKRRLLINLFEEETGALSKTDNHVVLMQNFLRAIGVSDAERDAVIAFEATKELIDYRMKLVRNPATFHLGAAAVLVASEGQNLETRAGEARHSVLQTIYGLSDREVLFFSVHQKEDVGHVREGLDCVADACSTTAMQEEALSVVTKTCGLFRNMYSGIWEAYQQHCSRPAA